MRVYHFIAEKWAKEALKQKRLKVSNINTLNDPFEFHVGFSKPNRKIINTFRVWKKEISKEFGILCFSKNWHNPLLWSHYAEKHTGFALGFEIQEDKATKITYSKSRPLFKWDGMPRDPIPRQNFLDKLIKTKFVSWKYEEEYRLVYKLNTLDYEDGFYFQEFDTNLVLKEVIAGCNSKMSDKEFLNLLDGYTRITAIKSRMALKKFSIVRNREKVWNINN